MCGGPFDASRFLTPDRFSSSTPDLPIDRHSSCSQGCRIRKFLKRARVFLQMPKELKLCPGAVEIVPFTCDLEISVARKMIRQKTNTIFVSQQFPGSQKM